MHPKFVYLGALEKKSDQPTSQKLKFRATQHFFFFNLQSCKAAPAKNFTIFSLMANLPV